MWIVINIAKSSDTAEKIEKLLAAGGILVKRKPVYKNVDDTKNYYKISVLESEVEEARDILMENGF